MCVCVSIVYVCVVGVNILVCVYVESMFIFRCTQKINPSSGVCAIYAEQFIHITVSIMNTLHIF